MRTFLLLTSRTFFSLIFIVSGFKKVFDWSPTINGFTAVLGRWHSFFKDPSSVAELIHLLAAFAPFFIALAVLFEIVGGMLVLINVRPRLGALLLLLVLLPATILYYDFWSESGAQFNASLTQFLKNLSIIGALLFYLAYTPRKSYPQ